MEMLVGEQVAVTVTVTAPDTSRVQFPTEALMPKGIEVLNAAQSPVEEIGDGMGIFVCQLILTSWDEGLYYLPPLNVMVNGKEHKTTQLALKVLLPENIDTTYVDEYEGPKYYGPKDVQSQPFDWIADGWYIPTIMAAALLALLVLTIWLYNRMRKNKPIIRQSGVVRRVLPHQRAMAAIDAIKADRTVAATDTKAYYTRLTDTLRLYINERYGFNAMEMTSSEIIDKLMAVNDPSALNELRELFLTADLVKFAKYATQMNENDANLLRAVDFIGKTKQDNQEAVVKELPKYTTQEQHVNRVRRLLKTLVIILGIFCILLFVAIVITIIMLM